MSLDENSTGKHGRLQVFNFKFPDKAREIEQTYNDV
jgi:hypothetical protein